MEIKKTFLTKLLQELDQALQLDDPIFIAFDVFNFTLHSKSSTLKKETNMATALPNKENVTEDSTRSFFINFDNAISCAQDKLNATIRELVQATKLESHKVESYKEEHPVTLDTVFSPGNQATEFTKSTKCQPVDVTGTTRIRWFWRIH